MDSIDITDSTFSLNVPDLNEFSDGFIGGMNNDYTIYIYIAAAIMVLIVGVFIYKFYQNKNNKQCVDDIECSGEFCTMNDKTSQI